MTHISISSVVLKCSIEILCKMPERGVKSTFLAKFFVAIVRVN